MGYPAPTFPPRLHLHSIVLTKTSGTVTAPMQQRPGWLPGWLAVTWVSPWGRPQHCRSPSPRLALCWVPTGISCWLHPEQAHGLGGQCKFLVSSYSVSRLISNALLPC